MIDKKFKSILKHIDNGTLAFFIKERWKNRINLLQYKYKIAKHNRCILKMHSQMIDGKIIKNIFHDIRLLLWEDSKLSEHIYCDGFEKIEQNFIWSYLRPGDIFLDIGANIGLYSIIAGKKVGSSGCVYSFEPTIKTYDRFCQNVKLNNLNNVIIKNNAISDRVGVADLNVSANKWDAWNSMTTPTGTDGSPFFLQPTETTSIDHFCTQAGLLGKITFIKIDVEGWETHVINGAIKVLSLETQNSPNIMIEFNNEALIAAGSSPEELFNILIDKGYTLYSFNEDYFSLKRYYPQPPYGLNLIATKNINYVRRRIRY